MQRYAVMEDVKGETRGAFETVNGFIDSIDTLMAHGDISASTTNKGHVQLSNATDSVSEALAATPKAVKAVYDLALEAKQSASDGKSAVANAVTAMGVFASPTDTFPTLAEKIGQINTGKNFVSGTISSPYINAGDNTTLKVTGLPFLPKFIFFNFPGYSYVNGAVVTNTSGNNFIITGISNVTSSGFDFIVAYQGTISGTANVTWYAFE